MVIRSYSQFKKFGECPHRWSLERKYEPRRKALALDEGTAFHLVLGKLYGAKNFAVGLDVLATYFGELKPRDAEDAERLRDKMNALASVTSAYWTRVALRDLDEFEIEHIEKPFSFDLGDGVRVVGYIDGVWRHRGTGVRFLVEHKYQGDLEDELMPLDLQVSLYTLALLPEYGLLPTLYNVCRKPALRQKKKETKDEFLVRVRLEVDEGSKDLSYSGVTGFDSRYLVRRLYSRGMADLDAALQQIRTQSRFMEAIERDPSLTWRNVGDHCLYWCPFRDICIFEDPIVVEEFFIVKRPFDGKALRLPGPAPEVRI
ncbi:MAG: PD-(D/E)XK nuclease family protein [Vicinamibacteria bacterium]